MSLNNEVLTFRGAVLGTETQKGDEWIRQSTQLLQNPEF